MGSRFILSSWSATAFLVKMIEHSTDHNALRFPLQPFPSRDSMEEISRKG